MEIKTVTENDIPRIVDLLKISLGESLIPKSERYWRWKHLENPFGSSPVLVCWDGNEIIGVRAFMRWEWIKNGQIFQAVRAVDTATHPKYQGKGIFKKLTLSLVNFCKESGHQFVFNTPNKQSKPGYIKMGWQEAGRLPIAVSIQRPISMLTNLFFSSKDLNSTITARPLTYFLEHPGLNALLERSRPSQQFKTNISVRYLRWRYLEVPVASYVAVGEENGDQLTGLIVGRIKQTRIGRELRITDVFTMEEKPGILLIKTLNDSKKSWNVDYCTISGAMVQQGRQLLGSFSLNATIGPTVTLRCLTMTDLTEFENFKNWSPSLGDLELF
jgi:GNAT superfamily N-acetyltransferase